MEVDRDACTNSLPARNRYKSVQQTAHPSLSSSNGELELGIIDLILVGLDHNFRGWKIDESIKTHFLQSILFLLLFLDYMLAHRIISTCYLDYTLDNLSISSSIRNNPRTLDLLDNR